MIKQTLKQENNIFISLQKKLLLKLKTFQSDVVEAQIAPDENPVGLATVPLPPPAHLPTTTAKHI